MIEDKVEVCGWCKQPEASHHRDFGLCPRDGSGWLMSTYKVCRHIRYEIVVSKNSPGWEKCVVCGSKRRIAGAAK